MEVVDSHVHIWDKPTDRFPWDLSAKATGPESTWAMYEGKVSTADDMVAVMDRIGVAAAVSQSLYVYGSDTGYACDAATRFPGRFGVVGLVRVDTPDVEEHVRTFRSRPGGLGIRFAAQYRHSPELLDGPTFQRIYKAAAQGGVPLFVWAHDQLPEFTAMIRAFPDTKFVITMFGLSQVDHQLERFGEILSLAQYPNVALQITRGASTARWAHPAMRYAPIGGMAPVIDAFGVERIMWGSDIGVPTEPGSLPTYGAHLECIRSSPELSESDKEWILGRSVRTFLDWSRVD